jgi:superkiller protein 3
MSPPNRPGRESRQVSEALRSLGYVGGSAAPKTIYTDADDLKNLAGLNRDMHTADEAMAAGDYGKAISLLTRVISQRPDTADAVTSLARAHWSTGDAPAAIGVLDRALASGVEHEEIRLRLGLYLAESRIDVARGISVLRTLPDDDIEALNALGVAYGAGSRWTEAIATFERILTIEPGNALALQNIAAMHLSRNDLLSAERFARQATDRDPQLAKAHTTLGVIFARTDRRTMAIDAWKRAVALDPSEFDALYNLVVLLADSGLIGEARTYARQFVDTAPQPAFAREIDQLSALLR